MNEISLIRDRFNLIIDYFSSVELDNCVESVSFDISCGYIQKNYTQVFYSYQYSNLYGYIITDHESFQEKKKKKKIPRPRTSNWMWNTGPNNSTFLSANLAIDHFTNISSWMDKPNVLQTFPYIAIPMSMSIKIDLTHCDIRYKQSLYDLCVSIRDQIGVDFPFEPSIPCYDEDSFYVSFRFLEYDDISNFAYRVVENLNQKEKIENEKEEVLTTVSENLDNYLKEMQVQLDSIQNKIDLSSQFSEAKITIVDSPTPKVKKGYSFGSFCMSLILGKLNNSRD
jgi:hypothetical protein